MKKMTIYRTSDCPHTGTSLHGDYGGKCYYYFTVRSVHRFHELKNTKVYKEDLNFSLWHPRTKKKKELVIGNSQSINRFILKDAYPLSKFTTIISEIEKHRLNFGLNVKSAYHQIPLRKAYRSYTAFEACGKLYNLKKILFGNTHGVAEFQRILDEIIEKEALKATFANIVWCNHL